MKTTLTFALGGVLSLLVTLGSTLNAAEAADAADEFVADELLVGFQPGTPGARADAIRRGLGATRIETWPQINAEHWHLPPGLGVAKAMKALSANPNVLYAEPNYIVHAEALSTVPEDSGRGELQGLHNIAQTGGTTDADIDALEAWQLSPGDAPVVVGVIDSGIDYTHEDLEDMIWVNPGEIPGNGIDDDGNGYVDDVNGWDFANGDNDPMDDYSHGTHVSGTIAATGNNGLGVVGVAGLNPNVKLMPLKFILSIGYGSTADATSCILYAASFEDASGNKVVRITNNSWGGGGKSKTLERAIKNSNALFVASAGNDGADTVHYPASYSLPNIVAVAATDANDALASFSNYGSWVHLAAPGVSILSTTPGDNYGYKSGTSMAAPHVSGVAALLMAQYPALSVDDIKAQILNTVDSLPALAGLVSTGGRLNAARALGAPELPPDTVAPAPATDLVAVPESPTSITLTWTAPGDDDDTGTAWLYDIRYSYSAIETDDNFAAAVQVDAQIGPQAAGTEETLTLVNLLDERTYYFALKTTDAAGNVSPLSQVASATTPPSDWHYIRLDYGQNVGNYASLDVTSEGHWAVAYDHGGEGTLRCASYSGGGFFTREIVMPGGFGPSLAYSPSKEISISHVDSSKALWFVVKNGSSWTSTKIESKDVNPYETSLVFDGAGEPVVSYFKNARRSSGLWVARRSGSAWSTQAVDPKAAAVYNQLAIGPAGEPAIAYSADADGDGAVDTLKFAFWNGAAWDTSVVDAGGAYVTVAYDFTTGNPAVAHWNAATGELRYLAWDGTGWGSPEIVDTAPSITGCSVAFGPDGNAYLAYGSDVMRLALRDPLSGTWSVQIADPSTSGSLRNTVRGRPQGTPTGLAYRGPAEPALLADSTVRLAIRQTPY